MAIKQVSPVAYENDGSVTMNFAADEANGNWLYAARLQRRAEAGDKEAQAELDRMLETPLYEITGDAG